MAALADLPAFYAPDRATWRAWLAAHHHTTGSIWLIYDKKIGSQPALLPYGAMVEEALCFGWIDSRPRKRSATQGMLLFSPRQAGSGWSAVNKARLEKLRAHGLLMPAGEAKIAAAQHDGSWTLLDEVESLIVPPDLATALRAVPAAETCFQGFAPSVRKGLLQWLNAARRPVTRAHRLAEIVRLAAVGQVANQWRRQP